MQKYISMILKSRNDEHLLCANQKTFATCRSNARRFAVAPGEISRQRGGSIILVAFPQDPKQPVRFRIQIKYILKCLLLACTVASLFGCKPADKTDDTPAPKISENEIMFATNAPQLASITIAPAQESNAATISLFGRLAWNDSVTVRVFSPVAGRITKIPAELNQSIAAGDALAEIDSPDFGQALADARTAAGNFAAADKAFSRAKELLAHGAAAQKDVEAAEAADIAARAEKDRAIARLANYGGNLESTNGLYLLRSPLAGVLVEKNVTPGQEIRSDAMLANAPQFFSPQFVVTDPTRLWVQLDVPESDLRQLQRGLPLVIRSKSLPDDQFTGTIDAISESLDPTTHTVTVRGVVDNSTRKLKAEMFVTVELANEAAAKLQVPAKAIYLRGEAHFVFVEEQPGTFRRHEVKIGETSGESVEVLDGLKSGERVVVDGALLLEQMFE
jgi:cobalt-zinc-cadmium efflux system membrane fusion protein